MSGEKQTHTEVSSPKARLMQAPFLGITKNVDSIDALQLMADSSSPVKQLKEQSNRINDSQQVQKLRPPEQISTNDSTAVGEGGLQLGSDSTETYQLEQFKPGDKGYDLANEKGTDPDYNKKKLEANNEFMNQSSPFAHEGFKVFSERISKLFVQFGHAPGQEASIVARNVWRTVYDEEKLQQQLATIPMSDPARGWIDMEALRERHVQKAQDDVLASFSIVENSVRTALQSQFSKAKSFAFWSGPVAKEIVLNHNGADIGLETSALGGLFNDININGKWDGALWAGLSHMYANAVVANAKGKEVRVFCSPNAALKNIYTAVEFPALKSILSTSFLATIPYVA